MFVYGSLLQGGLVSHPVFRIVLCVVLVRISKDGRVTHFWAQVLVWLYVDDVVFPKFRHVPRRAAPAAEIAPIFSRRAAPKVISRQESRAAPRLSKGGQIFFWKARNFVGPSIRGP